jgi:hypothetical protein
MLYMINAGAAAGLSGFLEWSEPVIYDRLVDAYQERLGRGSSPWGLARMHARTWRALMAGDMMKYVALRRDLIAALAECHLDLDDLAKADAQILVELLEVVMGRYQRSMSTAKSYHLALIALAAQLAPQAQATAHLEAPLHARAA